MVEIHTLGLFYQPRFPVSLQEQKSGAAAFFGIYLILTTCLCGNTFQSLTEYPRHAKMFEAQTLC